jgi:hypothetical protein
MNDRKNNERTNNMNDINTTVIKTVNGRRGGYTTNSKVYIDKEFAADKNLTQIELHIYDNETDTTTELVFDRSQFKV